MDFGGPVFFSPRQQRQRGRTRAKSSRPGRGFARGPGTGRGRIGQDIELRVWEVETKAGSRKFQTELDSWPEPITGGGWIIRDITGDLYRIPRPEELDQASRSLLWAFLD